MASGEKLRVLIGFLSDDKPEGSVPAITRVFIGGLRGSYEFIPLHANRRLGKTRHARLNLLNGYYFVKHLAVWIFLLVRYRPHIAHYPITSYWNLEKSLVFLRIARWFGARTIGHLHGGAFVDFWKTLSPARKAFAQAEFKRMRGLITLSEGWRQKLIQEVMIDGEKIFVVTNPIDPDFERACLAMPVGRKGTIMLALGVMDSKKGVFDLIDAAALIKERLRHRIMLVGPEREPGIHKRIQAAIARHGLSGSIAISSGVWGSDKVALFNDACALLLPSYWENLPLVVIEAAAAGIPSIVTPVGAIPEFFVSERSALFVNPGDVNHLAQALLEMTENDDKRERLGRGAREAFLTTLSRQGALDALRGVYDRVARGLPPGAVFR